MNETEAILLFGRKFLSENDYLEFTREVFKTGVKILLLTIGEKGSLLFYKSKNDIEKISIPPYLYGKSKEVTGCGDAYAAGFLSEYLFTQDPPAAAAFAGKVAGFKAGLSGSNKLDSFANFSG